MMKPLLTAVFLAAASPVFAQDGGDMTPNSVDVVEAASATGNVDKLLQAVMEAGLAETLANASDVTILAPIDPAFDAVEGLDALMAEKARLAEVLKYHVIPARYLAADIPQGSTQVQTLAGETLTFVNENGSISVTTPSGVEAMVVRQDIRADNGVVHAINKVLTP